MTARGLHIELCIGFSNLSTNFEFKEQRGECHFCTLSTINLLIQVMPQNWKVASSEVLKHSRETQSCLAVLVQGPAFSYYLSLQALHLEASTGQLPSSTLTIASPGKFENSVANKPCAEQDEGHHQNHVAPGRVILFY